MPLAWNARLKKAPQLLQPLADQKHLEAKARVAIAAHHQRPVRLQPMKQMLSIEHTAESKKAHDAEVDAYNKWRNARIDACHKNLASFFEWLRLCDAILSNKKHKNESLLIDKAAVLLSVAEIYEELGCFKRTLRENNEALNYYNAALKIYPHLTIFGSHIQNRITADEKEVEEISKDLKLM